MYLDSIHLFLSFKLHDIRIFETFATHNSRENPRQWNPRDFSSLPTCRQTNEGAQANRPRREISGDPSSRQMI